MPYFKIVAKREVYAEFEIEAESAEQAEHMVQMGEFNGPEEDYYYDWFPWEFDEVLEVSYEDIQNYENIQLLDSEREEAYERIKTADVDTTESI